MQVEMSFSVAVKSVTCFLCRMDSCSLHSWRFAGLWWKLSSLIQHSDAAENLGSGDEDSCKSSSSTQNLFRISVHSFINSGHFYSTPSSPLLLRGTPNYSTDTVSRRSAQATAGTGLAQGPYVAARAGVEPTTLQLKVITSTNAPPHPVEFIW